MIEAKLATSERLGRAGDERQVQYAVVEGSRRVNFGEQQPQIESHGEGDDHERQTTRAGSHGSSHSTRARSACQRMVR